MAYFYGNLEGNRGEATRMGSAASGIRASVRSFTGSATLYMYDKDGETWIRLSVINGSAVGGTTMWEGPISALLEADKSGDARLRVVEVTS